jgi:uncharacterized RmlC-like cupin family protein
MNKDMTIEEFTLYWMENKPLKSPQDDGVTFVENIHGVILYRDYPFQVELFTMEPNTLVEPHKHPNVETVALYVSGDIDFQRKHKWYIHPFDMFKGRFPYPAIKIGPDVQHTARTGPKGGSFLTIQRWLNNTQPKFIGNDWSDNNNKTSYEDSRKD